MPPSLLPTAALRRSPYHWFITSLSSTLATPFPGYIPFTVPDGFGFCGDLPPQDCEPCKQTASWETEELPLGATKPCCQANDSLSICFNLGSCQEETSCLTPQTWLHSTSPGSLILWLSNKLFWSRRQGLLTLLPSQVPHPSIQAAPGARVAGRRVDSSGASLLESGLVNRHPRRRPPCISLYLSPLPPVWNFQGDLRQFCFSAGREGVCGDRKTKMVV